MIVADSITIAMKRKNLMGQCFFFFLLLVFWDQFFFGRGPKKMLWVGPIMIIIIIFFLLVRGLKKLHLMMQTDRPPDRWTTEDGNSMTEKMDKVVELVGGGSVVNGACPI